MKGGRHEENRFAFVESVPIHLKLSVSMCQKVIMEFS